MSIPSANRSRPKISAKKVSKSIRRTAQYVPCDGLQFRDLAKTLFRRFLQSQFPPKTIADRLLFRDLIH